MSDKLNFKKEWISKANILGLYSSLGEKADLISLDLDRNDIYLVEELLSNKVSPKLFIVEYNAKFPPNVEFKIDYDTSHTWRGDDYFGASLKSSRGELAFPPRNLMSKLNVVAYKNELQSMPFKF